ncbi:mitochondrial ribonuclease P catalytic subunit isoform X2 [Zootoca vivipara]|uniref:mitochondrial ribonuclease P catalytic subunit isoform X2 n=1 Tax=Zootoca vivipara TaxID=8524 RepID=UPI0015911F74|nr:mitochondrial ribonuclease P catalytic subunit isoform X2 [Zootoca vivipara]XP_060128891.1 mitochondrial ribonuclease P catalytic subunit isoform X2 [Zootoca vivipara]
MVFFHQTSTLGLLKSLKKSHMFYPMPKLQQVPTVLGCFIFTTSYQCAKPVDHKTTTLSFKGKGEGIRETRVRKDYSSPSPFNLFAAGASKRRSGLCEAIEDSERSILSRRITLHPPEKPLSAGEWEELKGQFEGLRKFEVAMFEQMIACNSPIDVAKSLLAAVANREGDIHYNILLKYLRLCVSQGSTEEIYDVHDILKARFKTLETSGYGLLIRGLSGTPRWREALSLLEELKKVMTPSKSNYGDCIRGALLNREINLACELFHEMLAKDLVPNLDTLQIFFDTGKRVKDDILKTELMHILSYLRDNQVYPGEALMQSIKQWFESGQCPSCNQSLEGINLSPEEYNTLKERIIKDVIQGTDTFRKTTPQELEEFQTFVNQCPPFDIVIDGLNVSRVYNKATPSQTLLNVVSYLAQQNPRMLILGRKHMQKQYSQWHRNHMAALQKKAYFFFTENMSEDDPFLLYATLHSGSHCRFVTRDLLRDHKACLSDSLTRRLFFKWQRGHQMVLSDYIPGKRIKFESVFNYDTIVQTTGNTWHIPYDDNILERSSYEVPTKWLCLQQK